MLLETTKVLESGRRPHREQQLLASSVIHVAVMGLFWAAMGLSRGTEEPGRAIIMYEIVHWAFPKLHSEELESSIPGCAIHRHEPGNIIQPLLCSCLSLSYLSK